MISPFSFKREGDDVWVQHYGRDFIFIHMSHVSAWIRGLRRVIRCRRLNCPLKVARLGLCRAHYDHGRKKTRVYPKRRASSEVADYFDEAKDAKKRGR